MNRTALVLALALNITFLVFSLPVSAASNKQASANFDQLVDEYFDFHFQFHPTDATSNGFHQYDHKLEDYSANAVEREIAGLNQFKRKFERLSTSSLTQDSIADKDLLISSINGRLLELNDIQMWRKNPDSYSSNLSYSIFLIMVRNFAPPEDRLRAVIDRERQVPKVFAAAHENLKNPPLVYTQVALQQLPGIISFFKNDVPEAFSAVKDPALLAEFKSTNDVVIKDFQDYQTFLQKDLLPISKGDFRIGAENYRKKLLYDQMVDIPLDKLLQIGHADLQQNQQRLKEIAAQIDPKRTPLEVLGDLQKDHPAAAQLLQVFRGVLGGLREFIEQKEIVTIPSSVPPIVEETPPFARALTLASMDSPGPYETKATEAMFNVTLPDSSWNASKVEEWMEGFNRGTIISTAIHEVYSGHYTQFLWVKQAPSKVRKLIGCSSNAEGWAHYSEQMMLDEGYGNGDLKLRLGQLDDALLRNARFIVGIEMHTGKMTQEQAQDFFVKEGYQVPAVAEQEAKRGTSDPTYLVYTLGKLQIMKLRHDYQAMRGDQFKLGEFHDTFMHQGAIPLKIIRRAMLGNDSPTL
jgi:uncharacterized protein (DUF885 family)